MDKAQPLLRIAHNSPGSQDIQGVGGRREFRDLHREQSLAIQTDDSHFPNTHANGNLFTQVFLDSY